MLNSGCKQLFIFHNINLNSFKISRSFFQPQNSAVVPTARRTPRAKTLPDATRPSCPSWPRLTSAGCPKREARRGTLQLGGSLTWNTVDAQSKFIPNVSSIYVDQCCPILKPLITCDYWSFSYVAILKFLMLKLLFLIEI